MQADADMIKAYRDFVRFRQERNPCVRGLSAFLETPRLPQDLCQIYVVHVDFGGNPDESQEVQKVHYNQLPSALEPPPPGRGRLIVIEDLHPSVLEVLGVTLDIDPIFFADYVITNLENIERSPAPPSVALTPSQIQSRGDWFHIHYQQVIDLGPDGPPRHSPWVLKTFANVPRAVRRLPPLHGRQLGIARACFSILTKCLDQSWIAVVLVDSSTSDLIPDSTSSFDSQFRLRRVPLHDGFEDFQQPPSFSSFRSCAPRLEASKQSLLQQLLRYYSQYPPLIQPVVKINPLGLAYYPLKIIVGEWMLYGQLVARYIKHYEYSLNDTNYKLHEDELMDLQKWRHRAIQTNFKLESVREFINYHSAAGRNTSQWESLLKDLTHLSHKIERYGQCIERIIPIATSVIQLYHYRRSLSESVNVRRLTYMALIFVPLSWVAAIFSMANEFAPGRPKFWIYFVVSIPFSLAFVTGSMVLTKSWAWAPYRPFSIISVLKGE